MLASGADVNAKSSYGWTALMLAIYGGHKELLSLLLDKKVVINGKINKGYMPLMMAVQMGDEEVTSLLLEKGANVNAVKGDGWMTLMSTMQKDYRSDKGHDGWTALMFASKNGDNEIASLLLDYGANIDVKNNDDQTALTIAAYNGHTEVMLSLLDKGADTTTYPSSSSD